MARRRLAILERIRKFAAEREIRFTLKARRELASLELCLDEDDACEVLANLNAKDSAGRLKSAATGEWMYVFKPQVAQTILYVKVIVRKACIVISFHEEENNGNEESS
jgi:MqsR (Motility quorum-sensing regulator) toxin of toxin-antitoxin system